jgi:hypothetical protein
MGSTIVLPGGSTEPSAMRALRDADVTTFIGAPRPYEVAAIADHIGARGRALRLP